MQGIEFYEFLRRHYIQNGQPLYGNFTFCEWLYKKQDGTFSFRFNIPGNSPKAILRDILIGAWDANIIVDDNWLEEIFHVNFHKDCRLHILNFLLKEHHNLR